MFDFEGFFTFWKIVFAVALVIAMFILQAVLLFKFFDSKGILQEAVVLAFLIPIFTTGSVVCNIKWDKF